MNNSKKILVLAPEAICPANTGGRIVVFNKIKYLAELGYDIVLFCIVDSDREAKFQNKILRKLKIRSYSYNRNKHKIINLFKSLSLPYSVASRNNRDLKKDLASIINNEQINIIDVEFPQMAINIIDNKLIQSKNIKVILNQHNIEYRTMQNIGNTFSNPLKRCVFKFDAMRLKKFENKLYYSDIFNAYTFLSSNDFQLFKRDNPTIKVPCRVFGIGAEKHRIWNKNADSKNVIIVGKMSYQPNIEGVLWFVKEVWPIVKRESPDSKLYIVGKDPVESLTSIKDRSVVVTGTVDSVTPYYENSGVVAIPIFSGGGVKTKLIEAASYGMPIITTPSGVLGTDFSNDEQVIVTKNNKVFARNIIAALNKDENMIQLANNAYNLFLDEYTWKGICMQLSQFFNSLCEGK